METAIRNPFLMVLGILMVPFAMLLMPVIVVSAVIGALFEIIHGWWVALRPSQTQSWPEFITAELQVGDFDFKITVIINSILLTIPFV